MTKKMHKILILEDEEAHAELIRRAFRKSVHEYELTFARTVKEAKAAIGRDPPDLIIADWLVPDGRGIDILTRKQGLVTIPLIIMTSHGDEKLAVEMMKSGVIDYIVKTESTFQDLPHSTRRALREWENIQERKHAEQALSERARDAVRGHDSCLRQQTGSGWMASRASVPLSDDTERPRRATASPTS